MSVHFSNRLSGHTTRSAPSESEFGLWHMRSDGACFMNSFPVLGDAYLVPDASSMCTITWGSQYTRSVTTIPCGHVPSEVETSRILAIGDEVTNLDVREASWQSLLKILPILANLPDLTRMLPLDRDISELLKYLEAACRRPRNQLIVEPEPVRIERARRISPKAESHLAAHTEDWESRTLYSVHPNRVLAMMPEDQWE